MTNGDTLKSVSYGPGPGEVRAGHFHGLFKQVQNYGGDPRAILEWHEIDPISFADPDSYLNCEAVINLMEYCADRFGDPLFGARLARQQSVDVFGAAAAVARAAPTFGEGLECVRDYLPVVHFKEGWMELHRSRDRAEHRWTGGTGLYASNIQGNFQSLVLQHKILELLGGPDFKADYVLLNAEVSARDQEQLADWIGCRVTGGQDCNAIGFSSKVLDWPIATSNRMLFTLIKSHLENFASTQPGLVDRVRAYLREHLASGTFSLEKCARAVGSSRRGVQWRLQAEGLTFTDLVEQERIEQARILLAQSEMPIVEIAARLGYSEQSSFCKASKRWFGVSPRDLRNEARSRKTH